MGLSLVVNLESKTSFGNGDTVICQPTILGTKKGNILTGSRKSFPHGVPQFVDDTEEAF